MSETRTWREAIKDADRVVHAAEAERSRIIRAARESGLSVRKIASVLDVDATTVWRWSGGKMGCPSIDSLVNGDGARVA